MNKIRQAYKAGWWQNAQKPISDEHIIAMEAWEQADWDVYVILNNIPLKFLCLNFKTAVTKSNINE